MSIKDFLKAETERLGFPIFGVTQIAPPAHIHAYRDWISRGLHAGMEYLSRPDAIERRANPALIQPGALSLLLVGMRYSSPDTLPAAPGGNASGRVAAYAWGGDYHETLLPILAQLLEALKKYLGREINTRSYTDTGPVLERDFAQAAGLGWAGKNTCLIAPRHGSYFLLGESFLDVDIEPTAPFTSDHCGTCRRCIDGCPTGAIREDRTLDSHLCISYQTIENKGPIPDTLRPAVGDWVFGCDICQQVCPWNLRFAAPGGHPALNPRPEAARPLLARELTLSPQEFNFKFRKSPIRRAKRRGYLRNIAVAAGNSGDAGCVPVLADTLENEPEELVRAHAAWALGRLKTRAARTALDKAVRNETSPSVSHEIVAALEHGN